jgi:uncharacterized protein (DUF2147 family)
MKKTVKSLFVLILVLMAGSSLKAQTYKADDVVGTWLNEEKTGKVQIFKVSGSYYGKITWLRDPNDVATGKPRTDIENPDASKRNIPLIGLVNLKGFVFDGKDEWKDGTIYDPKNGKTYSCFMKFENPNLLKIRGYIGISVLGRNTMWTRVTP